MGKVTDPAILEQLNAPAAPAPRSGGGAPLRGGRIITDPVYARERRTAANEATRIDIERERLGLARAANEREQERFRLERDATRARTIAAIADIDEQLGRAQGLLDNPALSSITGSFEGGLGQNLLKYRSYLPGQTDAPLSAFADWDALVSKSGLNELQNLKAMSPTGGAVGQVSDFEQRLLQAAAGAFTNRVQSDEDYLIKLQDYADRLSTARSRLLAAYQQDYGESLFGAPSGATTAAPSNEATQEFDWSPDKGVTPRRRQ